MIDRSALTAVVGVFSGAVATVVLIYASINSR